jgi:hypothetical protein
VRNSVKYLRDFMGSLDRLDTPYQTFHKAQKSFDAFRARVRAEKYEPYLPTMDELRVLIGGQFLHPGQTPSTVSLDDLADLASRIVTALRRTAALKRLLVN